MKCVDCAYLVRESHRGKHTELTRYERDAIQHHQREQPNLLAQIRFDIHCYRHRWNGKTISNRGKFPDVYFKQLEKRQLCGVAFPYSEGSPEEHRVTHRTVSTRRWLLAGGFLGPYAATSAGFLAAQAASVDGIQRPSVVFVLAVGAGIVAIVLAINHIFVRH
jgi:hypothetical protein